ncbi:DUF7674 family protein [Leptospira andrefontaineae]|uniref:DUF7674 domain-containing protein n=1 Tax=Leptospira andrefontaineae TaxID=2484976 RepID=A0A4R9H7B8_9LEPT|nr:hypothetical protein [Leptospira andrefontaineae]TGK41524.1 hypothetical protein EHO65_08885 [Leptospira andrefontaineae]
MNPDFDLFDHDSETLRVKGRLTELFNDFEITLRSSLFAERNGGMTIHGIFAEFSHYFNNNYESFGDDQLIELFAFIEDCLITDYDVLNNAVYTCFLENIDSSKIKIKINIILGEKTSKYLKELDM